MSVRMGITLPSSSCPGAHRPAVRRVLGNQSGVALFMVIWILALLVVIVGQFSFSMRAEVNAARQFKEAAAAYYIAEAGVNRAILEILKQNSAPEEREAAGLAEDDDTLWRVNVPLPEVPFAEGHFRVYIDNESGKVNINTAERGVLQMLVDHLEIDESEKDTIVDAILDWRDSDDLHRLNGAESDFYQALPEPYRCKNGPFDSVSELLLVRGITPDIYYNGLQEMITVALTGAEGGAGNAAQTRSFRMTGGGVLNINAARAEMLAVLPKMTEDVVQDILLFRENDDFRSLEEVADVVGPDVFEAVSPFITLRMSPYYVIHTEGRLDNSSVRQLVSMRVKIDPAADPKFVVQDRLLN